MFDKYVDSEMVSGYYLQVFCAVENFLAFLCVPPVVSVWLAGVVYHAFFTVTITVSVLQCQFSVSEYHPNTDDYLEFVVSVCLKVSLSSSYLQRSSTC